MTIRCQLRSFRRAHNISLRVLAAATGIPKSVLSRLETGKSGRVDFDVLNTLVDYFNHRGVPCTVGDLLVYEEASGPDGKDD